MDRMIAFGQRMRAIREDRGYSQERVAELACLHRTYIGGVERGERNVSLLNIWRIADALGVNPSVLLMAPDEVNVPADALAHHRVKKGDKWTKRSKR